MDLMKNKETLEEISQENFKTTKNTGQLFNEGKLDFRTMLFNLQFKWDKSDEKKAETFQNLKNLQEKELVDKIGFKINDNGDIAFFGILSNEGERQIKMSDSKQRTNSNPGGEQLALGGVDTQLERNVVNKEYLPSTSQKEVSEEIAMTKEMLNAGTIEKKSIFGNTWYKNDTYIVTVSGEERNQYSLEETTKTKIFK